MLLSGVVFIRFNCADDGDGEIEDSLFGTYGAQQTRKKVALKRDH